MTLYLTCGIMMDMNWYLHTCEVMRNLLDSDGKSIYCIDIKDLSSLCHIPKHFCGCIWLSKAWQISLFNTHKINLKQLYLKNIQHMNGSYDLNNWNHDDQVFLLSADRDRFIFKDNWIGLCYYLYYLMVAL